MLFLILGAVAALFTEVNNESCASILEDLQENLQTVGEFEIKDYEGPYYLNYVDSDFMSISDSGITCVEFENKILPGSSHKMVTNIAQQENNMSAGFQLILEYLNQHVDSDKNTCQFIVFGQVFPQKVHFLKSESDFIVPYYCEDVILRGTKYVEQYLGIISRYQEAPKEKIEEIQNRMSKYYTDAESQLFKII